MRYLELKDGWLNLDTMEKRQYGEFVIEAFNTEGEAYEEILSRTGKDKSNYIFEKKEIQPKPVLLPPTPWQIAMPLLEEALNFHPMNLFLLHSLNN